MRRRARDWSIGRRLAAGFGVVALVLAVFSAIALGLQQRSASAQASFVERYAPRLDAAVAVERAVLGVAVAIRGHLLTPDAEHAASVREALAHAREALQVLAAIPKDPDGVRLFNDVQPAVEAYLAAVAANVESAALANPRAAEEALARTREAAVRPLREFANLQQVKAGRALAAMGESRRAVESGLALAFVVIGAILLAFGWATAVAIRNPARELTRVAHELQAGRWKAALEFGPTAAAARGESLNPRSELAQIALAFGAAAESLERREHRLRADAEVATATSSSLDREAVARQALRAMAAGARASMGAVYWREGDALEPIATHAMGGPAEALRLGEGLPGQAAREGRVLVLEDIPADTKLRLRLGVDDAIPRAVIAVPAVLRGEVHAVVVLASLRGFDADTLDFLQSASLQLAVGLSNVRAHDEVQGLLARLREAHQEVQAQNEELQAQNEEIQAQGEELQAQNEEIQAQSEELQAQNEELQRHASDLAQADARKNHFLGVLSHELRNPLAAIANSIFLLGRRGEPSDEEVRGLETIERQMRYLTRLIDDLLDVTRISHDKLHLQREPLDLVPLARDVLGDFRAAAGAAGVALDASLPPGPVFVDGDRTRLAQVLGNLLSNAIKFTPRGGAVQLRMHAEAGSVSVHVRDSGPGIDAAIVPRLFQPFSQGDPGLARPHGGLGLGLALSKALAKLHDGTVRIANPGEPGAELVVTLPVTAKRPAAGDAPPPPSRRARRILLIEDNDDAAETLRMALCLEGHQVDVARSGTEGVEKARILAPEVVLCDIGIPGLDGFEVARALAADPRLRGTTLIALSGYATAEDRARTAAAGFDHHLAKPVPLDALFTLIQQDGAARRARHAEAAR